MDWETEKWLAKDIEENKELYEAFADKPEKKTGKYRQTSLYEFALNPEDEVENNGDK